MATRKLKTRPEWEDALRSGRKTIDARLVADDIAELEVGDRVHYPGATARSSAFGSTPASVICWLTKTGTESRPMRPAATRCSVCSKRATRRRCTPPGPSRSSYSMRALRTDGSLRLPSRSVATNDGDSRRKQPGARPARRIAYIQRIVDPFIRRKG